MIIEFKTKVLIMANMVKVTNVFHLAKPNHQHVILTVLDQIDPLLIFTCLMFITHDFPFVVSPLDSVTL
jgi:hypothetical protein